MSSVYSSSLGPVPRFTNVDHMPGFPVKSEMRPPNSTDCLISNPSPVSPLFSSVVTEVVRSLDLCAASTLTPGVICWLLPAAPCSPDCCANSGMADISRASAITGTHDLLKLTTFLQFIFGHLPYGLKKKWSEFEPCIATWHMVQA